MQQYLEDSERDLIFQSLRLIPENKKCADCPKKNPTWASVYLGLLICYDCAGKHRQYGVHYSFVRSLELDKWNKRQITFMETGGNAKALQYFTKHGLSSPIDYKSNVVANYKNEQTKKVDAMLAPTTSQQKIEQPVVKTQKIEENNCSEIQNMSDAKTEGETNPFNNVKIDKSQTRTKGFSVEFTKNKTATSGTRGRLAAKKIDNLDLDMLTLQEENPQSNILATQSMGNLDSAPKEDVTERKSSIEEVQAPASMTELSDEERFKKFKGAKSISSSDFQSNGKENQKMDVNRFVGASSISSSQYFSNNENQSTKHVENAKEFLSNVGSQLKEKAGSIGSIFNKINTKWQDRNKAADTEAETNPTKDF